MFCIISSHNFCFSLMYVVHLQPCSILLVTAMFLFMLFCLCHLWDTLTQNNWQMIIIVHVICIDTCFRALPVQFCLLKLAFNVSDVVCRTAALKNIVCFAGTVHHLVKNTGKRNPMNALSLY
ncbi:unnamed protein product [Ixodes persulcatus]